MARPADASPQPVLAEREGLRVFAHAFRAMAEAHPLQREVPAVLPVTDAATAALRAVEPLVSPNVFIIQAGYLTPLMRALSATRLRTITCGSEVGCQFIASGVAHVSDKPAMVMSVAGPGAANLQGLYCCHANRIPLLWVVGGVGRSDEGTGAVQDSSGRGGTVRIESVLAPAVVYLCSVTRGIDLPARLYRAALECNRKRGPAVVLVPVDVQAEPVRPHGRHA
jgi:acetolactate synthase-1/2/3 large subunit